MRSLRLLAICAIPLFFIACVSSAQPTLETRDVIQNLDTPWEILWGPDNWIWFTERPGRVSRLNPTTGERHVILTITDVFEQSESGLLGMALHPNFADSSYVYLVYNYRVGSTTKERLVRYTYTADTLTGRFVLIEDLLGSDNHNGSRLLITPDLKLLMTTGDTQSMPLAQDHTSLSGKILRMNLDGTPAADNPWPNAPGLAKYLWTTGHRNPQGLVRAPNGIIYSSEHGPNDNDELNIIDKGRNYGWPTVHGYCDTPAETTFCADSNVHEPIRAWTPTLATAGLDYYGSSAIPEWTNSLLLVTLKESDLRQLKLSADGTSITGETIFFNNKWGRIRDLCVAPDGRVFLATSEKDGRGSPIAGDDRIIEVKNSAAPTVAIINVAVNKTTYRAGDSIIVTYETTGGAFNANNVFTAQLSDPTGGFNLATPLGVLSATGSGTIRGLISCGLGGQTNYRVRVVGSSPVAVSADNGIDLTIIPMPSTDIFPSGDVNLCVGDSVTITAGNGFREYLWNTGDRTRSITVAAAAAYSVSLRDSNGCRATSAATVVRVIPPPVPTVTLRSDTLEASSGFLSYQWYLNRALLQGETNRFLIVSSPGIYHVVVRTAEGCPGPSADITVGPLGVDRDDASSSGLRLSPHPATNHLTIEVDLGAATTPVEITINDINGNRVFTLNDDRASGPYRRDIPLTGLPSGTYFVQLQATTTTWKKKFIINNS